MIVKMIFKDGFIVFWYSYENEQLLEVISGMIRFWFNNNEEEYIDVQVGEFLVILGNVLYKVLIIGEVVVIDIFLLF